MADHIFTCPHCQGTILVYQHELNCRIFRHGVYYATMQPMNPHASKEECDRLVQSNEIMGCGKPFEVVECDGFLVAIACDYK